MPIRLGNCELLHKLGSGGMAEVWMARRSTIADATQTVAVKMLSGRLAGDRRYRELFIAEARLSTKLNHSNIVQVFDVGEHEGTAYIVMQCVDGLNLWQLASKLGEDGVRIPPAIAGYITGELLRALAYAHELVHDGKPLQIIHRDVSPHNVLVSTSGEVKLTDFGVARAATDETTGNHVRGKLRYMAPEQFIGGKTSPKVDLYAVGAILHELLEGKRFRDGSDDERELQARIVGGEIPPLSVADVPAELDALRLSLLQVDPERRVPAARLALEQLESWPGFRNASAELSRMCRACMGVSAPRSGAHAQMRESSLDSESEAQTVTAAPSWLARRFDSRPAYAKWLVPLSLATGASALVMAGLALISTFGGERPRVSGEVVPDKDAPAVGGALAGREVTGGSGPGAGTSAASSLGPGAEEDPPASAGATLKASLGAPTSPPVDAVQPPVESGSGEKETVERPKTRVGAKRPVSVRLGVDGGIRTAYLKFGRRPQVVLDPIATIDLPPGRHSMQWRLSERDPWQRGPSVTLDGGKAYELRVYPTGPKLRPTGR